MDTKPQDTFINEKIEVEVKEGDTVDTATIRHLVTSEADKFIGKIEDLKKEISGIEAQKNVIHDQLQQQTAMHDEAIKQLDSLIKEKQASIDKYLPEVEAKIRERQP